MASVSEENVGILCYRNIENVGFNGSIKQRFDDFVVNEIDTNGQVVTLQRMMDVKKNPTTKRCNLMEVCNEMIWPYVSKEKLNEAILKPVYDACFKVLQGNRKDVKMHERRLKWKRIEMEMKSNYLKSEDEKNEFDAFMKDTSKTFNLLRDNKEVRKNVHQMVRQFGGNVCTTETCSMGDGSTSVKLLHVLKGNGTNSNQNKKRDDRDRRGNHQWPKDRGDYLNFTLCKRNMDTNAVIRDISKRARLSKGRQITFAGTKDKRGITSQRCQVYRVPMEQLNGLNPKNGIQNAKYVLGDFKYTKDSIQLGDLVGNQFRIVIRNISLREDNGETMEQVVHQAVRGLKENGFINYFGLQRFGTSSVPTHAIGRLLLQHKWEEAVDVILSPRSGDSAKLTSIRENYKNSKNIQRALKSFPPYMIAEVAVLQGLQATNGQNYRAAIDRIPRSLRMMYTHAYQSYVWNSAVSARINQFGYHPVEGDLIVVDGIESLYNHGTNQSSPVRKKTKVAEIAVKPLTAQDIAQNTYTLNDIVLPLPGYNMQYPTNTIASIYKTMLEEDTIQFDAQQSKELNLTGGYRPIMAQIKNVSYAIKHYADYTKPIIESDFDHFEPPSISTLQEGPFQALCISFQLSSSCYATMCFRELMKATSHLDQQLQHNNSDP